MTAELSLQMLFGFGLFCCCYWLIKGALRSRVARWLGRGLLAVGVALLSIPGVFWAAISEVGDETP